MHIKDQNKVEKDLRRRISIAEKLAEQRDLKIRIIVWTEKLESDGGVLRANQQISHLFNGPAKRPKILYDVNSAPVRNIIS